MFSLVKVSVPDLYATYLSVLKTRLTVPIPTFLLYVVADPVEVSDLATSRLLVSYMGLTIVRKRGKVVPSLIPLLKHVISRVPKLDILLSILPYRISHKLRSISPNSFLTHEEEAIKLLRLLVATMLHLPEVYIAEAPVKILDVSEKERVVYMVADLGLHFILEYSRASGEFSLCIEELPEFCITEL